MRAIARRESGPGSAYLQRRYRGQENRRQSGRVMKLIEAKTEHDELVTELYLAALCRPPSEPELQLSRDVLKQSPTPAEGYQDLLWALINSKQFLFVH